MTRPSVTTVLIATNHLRGWSGSETLLLTLVDGLLQRGRQVAVYARHLDRAWAKHYLSPHVHVTDDIETLREFQFDIAHIQHSTTAIDVRLAFPSLPILFSSLGVLPFLEQPLPFDIGISRYLAISEEVHKNLVAHGIAASSIDIVGNVVDERQFTPLRPLRKRIERILVLSYKMDDKHASLLREAAIQIGASIRFIGLRNKVIPNSKLSAEINNAEVVVSLGRGAIETMLCGRVPLIFDNNGGDGLLTPNNLDNLSRCNFSGRRLQKEFSVDELVDELRKYDPKFGVSLRSMAIDRYSLAKTMTRILTIYEQVGSAAGRAALSSGSSEMLTYVWNVANEDRRFANHLRGEVDRIKSTVSWRITAPLRAIWNFSLNRL